MEHRETKVIIDCDPGADDTLALLTAFSHIDKVLAIVVTHGNVEKDKSWENVLRLYEVIRRASKKDASEQFKLKYRHVFAKDPETGAENYKTILVKGASDSAGDEFETASYFHGEDGLGNVSERPDLFPVPDEAEIAQEMAVNIINNRSAEDVVLDLLKEHDPCTITYCALAPLSTLAKIIEKDESTFVNRIERVVCMGGAVHVPGNVTKDAEFNWHCGPTSVAKVLGSSLCKPQTNGENDTKKFVLLPLDITREYSLYHNAKNHEYANVFEKIPSLQKPGNGIPQDKFINSLVDDTSDSFEFLYSYSSAFINQISLSISNVPEETSEGQAAQALITLHDPLAIMCASHLVKTPDDVKLKFTRENIKIETAGDIRGKVIVATDNDLQQDQHTWAQVDILSTGPNVEQFIVGLLEIIWGKR